MGIDGVFKSMHNLVDESPAKREDYQNITGSKVFHCLSVDTDGLKARKLQTELLMICSTLLSM